MVMAVTISWELRRRRPHLSVRLQPRRLYGARARGADPQSRADLATAGQSRGLRAQRRLGSHRHPDCGGEYGSGSGEQRVLHDNSSSLGLGAKYDRPARLDRTHGPGARRRSARLRRFLGVIALTCAVRSLCDRSTSSREPLENCAQLEDVQKAAGHRDAGTTKLYDRRSCNPEKGGVVLRDLLTYLVGPLLDCGRVALILSSVRRHQCWLLITRFSGRYELESDQEARRAPSFAP
jgi:hypothetical protein